MIQDLGSHCYHNEYHPVPPKGRDCILFFQGRKALVKVTGDSFSFPDFQYTGEYYPQIYTSYTYLFSIDQVNYYLIRRKLWTGSPDILWKTLSFSGTWVPR